MARLTPDEIAKQVKAQDDQVYGDDPTAEPMDLDEEVEETFGDDYKSSEEVDIAREIGEDEESHGDTPTEKLDPLLD